MRWIWVKGEVGIVSDDIAVDGFEAFGDDLVRQFVDCRKRRGECGGTLRGTFGGRDIWEQLTGEVSVSAALQYQVAMQFTFAGQCSFCNHFGNEMDVRVEQGESGGGGEEFCVGGGLEELGLVEAVDEGAVERGDHDAPVGAGR